MTTYLTEFLTAESLAKFLMVDRAKLLRWTTETGLPCIRVGREVYFHEPSVAGWLKGREQVSSGSQTEEK